VPKDFPFAREKLVLMPSEDRCHRPPRCCLAAELDAAKGKLIVSPPKEDGDSCGAPAWLVRLPLGEQRKISRKGQMP